MSYSYYRTSVDIKSYLPQVQVAYKTLVNQHMIIHFLYTRDEGKFNLDKTGNLRFINNTFSQLLVYNFGNFFKILIRLYKPSVP